MSVAFSSVSNPTGRIQQFTKGTTKLRGIMRNKRDQALVSELETGFNSAASEIRGYYLRITKWLESRKAKGLLTEERVGGTTLQLINETAIEIFEEFNRIAAAFEAARQKIINNPSYKPSTDEEPPLEAMSRLLRLAEGQLKTIEKMRNG
jgi:hypothetical protein